MGKITNRNVNEIYSDLSGIINIGLDFPSTTEDYIAGAIVCVKVSKGVFYLYFLCDKDSIYASLKVGEIEKSSLDGLRSLISGLNNGEEINLTFSLNHPESILKKMITVIVITISLTLFFIIYLLIQF